MRSHTLVPSATLPPNTGLNQTLFTAGYDFVSIFIASGVVGGGVATCFIAPDGGGIYSIGGLSMPASTNGTFYLGGAGGPSIGNLIAGAPFVPNIISLQMSAVAGSQWTYAVIGGWFD